MKPLILLLLEIFICFSATTQSALDIIPNPLLVKELTGKPFLLNGKTILYFQKQYSKAAYYYQHATISENVSIDCY